MLLLKRKESVRGTVEVSNRAQPVQMSNRIDRFGKYIVPSKYLTLFGTRHKIRQADLILAIKVITTVLCFIHMSVPNIQ